MGLDQRIWADIKVGDGKKQIAMHYCRKDYEIEDWFFSRLPETDRTAIEGSSQIAWGCQVTAVELDVLEAERYDIALRIGFDLELLWRCRLALGEGFVLSYTRSS